MAVSTLVFSEHEERDVAAAKLDKLAQSISSKVLCSRDPDVLAAKPDLTDLIPAHFKGVTRWFLPIAPLMPSDGNGRFSAFTSCYAPGATVTPQRLDVSIGAVKVVVSGSIQYRGHSLTAGDWIWFPAGETYEYTAEHLGAVLFTVLPCVEDAGDNIGLPVYETFVTSRDPKVTSATVSLPHLAQYAETGEGITHSFFPFAPRMPANPNKDGRFFAWLAHIAPGTDVPGHIHELERLADYKLVINGSIISNGRELTAGDWIWAPAGTAYSFTVGGKGNPPPGAEGEG
ncbi:hypothetical protein P154DRAFT_579700 [Amniculicola lignicola CBS 123094]|uniref:RmlC-like cupin n=1 Tax=Amniculicola lignicola CBS 123094 TaxID=1392246 RepID=A0A6A5W5M1_9PLEO|nr:hypothetical protein P154DRAFT_579700 [Amniculicola lignicola CBS 123094]